MRCNFAVIVVLSVCGTVVAQTHAAEIPILGRRITNFSLPDYHGKPHSLDELSGRKLVVVAFLGNDCPLAKLYASRLESLNQEFHDKGVAFVGINANRQDVPTRIAAYANKYSLSFPILKDGANEVTDAFGAVRTPEVFVLDETRTMRYHGRIDDQYGVGIQRPKVTRRDLAIALEELLAGKEVTVAETKSVGCQIGRASRVKPHGDVTYTKHIAAIFNKHCVECHREGELAPFSLTSYEESIGWAATIREVVSDGRMPPWFADPQYGHFANDLSLSAEEKQQLLTWIDNGYPEGNPADLPASPQFFKGWRIGQPDAVYEMKEAYTVPAEGTIEYQHFLVDPGFKEDMWISHAEARPGNYSVVHHVVVYVVPEEYKALAAAFIASQRAGGKLFGGIGRNRPDQNKRNDDDKAKDESKKAGADAKKDQPKADASKTAEKSPESKPDQRRRRGGRRGGGDGLFGDMVAIYAPGITPWQYPPGTALKIKKGSAFVFQIHYTPNGTEQTDKSYVGFRFAKPDTVKKPIRYGMAVNNRFVIPPNDANYVDKSSHTFDSDVLLLNMFPHMHYRGKSFRFEAVYPDKSREVLLDVPRYDFYWQLRYDLTEPKLLPKGTTLECTARFDNSEDNPLNPDPTQAVRFGLQSWEEMLVGYYTVVPTDNVPKPVPVVGPTTSK